jgi:hypothetical protein
MLLTSKKLELQIDDFLSYIEQGEIPPCPPEQLPFEKYYKLDPRRYCIERGMWAIVDKQWTKKLSKWVGKRTVLEIMAGAGWLSKALSEHGTSITATDDYSWDIETHTKMKRVYPVINMNSLEAIATFQCDILLCSWPPYADDSMYRSAKLWGNKKPIILISEGCGGCNATYEFFEGFERKKTINIPQWWGLHDYVQIGYWKGK